MTGSGSGIRDTFQHRNAGNGLMKSIEGADVIQKELPDILHDESRFESGVPDLVCFPASVEELETALGMARERGLRVTFIGAQTGTTAVRCRKAGPVQ